MGGARAFGALVVATAVVTLLPCSSAAEPQQRGIRLVQPVHGVDPLSNVDLGLRKDRLKTSQVPGRLHDVEKITAALGPSGAPVAVTDEQHLLISGAGNYVIRELGPARAAVGLGDTVPPVLELGTVVWQGFSPGRRRLAARLTLDPGIEAARLPMRAAFTFVGADGRRRSLGPGAAAPSDGTLTVTLTNNTTTQQVVDVGRADPVPLARLLNRLHRAAAHPRPAPPPAAGAGLPVSVPGARLGRQQVTVTAPLWVTGTIGAPGGAAAVRGPGTTPTAGGVRVAGTLTGSASFTVRLRAGQRPGLRLDVRPWLDPRTLAPPAPARSWRQWARTAAAPAAVTAATTTLTTAAAAAARAADYSPYLQADAPGSDVSSFRYVVAAPAATRRADDGLTPRPGALAAAAVAVLAVVGNAALLRRRL